MKILRVIFAICLLASVFVGGWYLGSFGPKFFSWEEPSDEPDDKSTAFVRVVAQGRLLPQNGLINVISPPGQRIEKLLVSVGDAVKRGETELATYSGQATVQLQSQLVESQSDDARRELAQKILSAENALLAADNALAAAMLQSEQAQETASLSVGDKQLAAAKERLERLTNLSSDPQTQLFVSKSTVDEQKLAIEQSETQLVQARKQQASAQRAAKLNVELAQKTRDQAQLALVSLQKMRAQNLTLELSEQIAAQQAELARLVAPIDGTVLKVFGRPGDVVVNSPLMQLGDVSQMVCNAEVVDRLVPKVKLNQRVIISSPALSRPLFGKVTEIGRVIGNGTLMDPNPLALVDRKTVDVRIVIAESDNELASQLVNLQVTVEIETDSQQN